MDRINANVEKEYMMERSGKQQTSSSTQPNRKTIN
jgi:hypothetical protein